MKNMCRKRKEVMPCHRNAKTAYVSRARQKQQWLKEILVIQQAAIKASSAWGWR